MLALVAALVRGACSAIGAKVGRKVGAFFFACFDRFVCVGNGIGFGGLLMLAGVFSAAVEFGLMFSLNSCISIG